MAGTVHIPWYATLLRGDKFALALAEIAPIAMRYGATRYQVHRSRDDRYRFVQMTTFDDHAGWERYWYGPEFVDWRADYSSWYQVPVLYAWNDVIAEGAVEPVEGSAVSAAP